MRSDFWGLRLSRAFWAFFRNLSQPRIPNSEIKQNSFRLGFGHFIRGPERLRSKQPPMITGCVF
jgi:hypothetical protein